MPSPPVALDRPGRTAAAVPPRPARSPTSPKLALAPAPPHAAGGHMSLQDVPADVLGLVFDRLDVRSLIRLRQTSRHMHAQVTDLGIPSHLRQHPVHHLTLCPPAREWPAPLLLRHHARIASSLSSHRLHALQIGATWPQPAIPVMHLSAATSRLILGVGGDLVVHALHAPPAHGAASVGRGVAYRVAPADRDTTSDIVGVHELRSGELVVAQFNGVVQRLHLGAQLTSTAHYAHPPGSSLHTVAGDADADVFLTTTTEAGGVVRLWSARSPWADPAAARLPGRAWSSALSTARGTALVGVQGAILALDTTTLTRTRALRGHADKSAPYALVFPAPGVDLSAWPHTHSHTLLSAWHDAYLRLYDLRVPAPDPVVRLHDPWSDAAFYSAAYVGAHGVAGGQAQHGLVGFWDLRRANEVVAREQAGPLSPAPASATVGVGQGAGGERQGGTGGGFTVYSPGGKSSPVYNLVGEGGRVWGTTERRAWVMSFDGSGETRGGLVEDAARALPQPERGAQRWTRGRGRGRGRADGRVQRADPFTPHKSGHFREVCMGYEHSEQGVTLFETLEAE
ncbi:hypothetical protein Q5752_002798 [Cryptotrichosporon argae]